MENLLEKAKEYRAVKTIVDRMENEDKVTQTDPQYKQAQEKLDKARIAFLSAAKETFVTLFYPVKDNKLRSANFLMEFTGNAFNGEEQVRKVLIECRKLEEDVSSDMFRQNANKGFPAKK